MWEPWCYELAGFSRARIYLLICTGRSAAITIEIVRLDCITKGWPVPPCVRCGHAPRWTALGSAPEVAITTAHSNRTLTTRGCPFAAIPLLSWNRAGGHLHWNHESAEHRSVVEACACHATLLHGLCRGWIHVVVAAPAALIVGSLSVRICA